MLFIHLLSSFVLQTSAATIASTYFTEEYKNVSVYEEKLDIPNRISETDALGALAKLMDEYLGQYYSRKGVPDKNSCTPGILPFGKSHELKTNMRPRGYCSYCCPLTNPKNHIWLYFASKLTNGNDIKLRLVRKSGMLRAAGVDSNSNTVIFIHGFTEYGQGVHAEVIRDAYLSREKNYNVILVDWGNLSAFPWYPNAANNTRVVGALLAKFIRFYNNTGELPISKLHVIGFSLGSHVAGFTGKFLQGEQKIPRITGLDPAFPMFSLTDPTQRLSEADAEFVDVIHTGGGVFGFPVSIGHADFYPNTGNSLYQPGCNFSALVQDGTFEQIVLCSHFHAVRFYAESVRNPTGFPATKCGIIEKGFLRKCRFIIHGYMGFSASKSTSSGNFYLTTNDHAPFARSAEEQEVNMKTVNLLL